MSLCYLTILPIKVGLLLILNQGRDHFPINMVVYQQLVGKLIYLTYETRPDIAFVIGQLSRYHSDLRVDHIRIAK